MYYISEFLNELRIRRFHEKTIKAYSFTLNHFQKYFEKRNKRNVTSINEDNLLSYFEKIGRTNNGNSFSSRIAKLRNYFKYLEKKGYIFYSPLNDYYQPKYFKSNYPIIDQNEIKEMLKNINPENAIEIKGIAMIELAYSSALRPSELKNLKISDINFKCGMLFIEQSKRQKDRLVPVGEQALFWLKKYITEIRRKYIKNKSHDFVFINHKNGKQTTLRSIRYAMNTTLKKVGYKSIKPYSLRSTSATGMLLNGMNILHISKILGHKELRTTQVYLRVDTHNLKKIINRIHPRNRMKGNN